MSEKPQEKHSYANHVPSDGDWPLASFGFEVVYRTPSQIYQEAKRIAGLSIKRFRTVIFNEKGYVANYKELMEGVPFVKQAKDQHGKDCREWGSYCWTRGTVVFIQKDDALRVLSDKKNRMGDSRPEGLFWGYMHMREHLLYAPNSAHEPKVFQSYEFYIHPESKRFDKKNHWGGYIKEDLYDTVAKAMDARSE